LESLYSFLVRVYGASVRKAGWGDIVSNADIGGVRVVNLVSGTDDVGFAVQAADFDEVLMCGLGVGVAEGVVGGGCGVPFRGEGFDVFGFGGCFWGGIRWKTSRME